MSTEYLIAPHLHVKHIQQIFKNITTSHEHYYNGSPCWIWTGWLRSGYGAIRMQGRVYSAHRLLYAWLVEPIPCGKSIKQLDHYYCNNKTCCNPSHLKLVSPRENILRDNLSASCINATKTHCNRGHELAGANVRIRPDTGARVCRACKRLSNKREYYKDVERARTKNREHMRARRRQLKLCQATDRASH